MSKTSDFAVPFDKANAAASHVLLELCEDGYKGFAEIGEGGVLCTSEKNALREAGVCPASIDVTLIKRETFSGGADALKTDSEGRVSLKKT